MTTASDSRTPELEEVLKAAIEYYLEDTHTSLPAKVIKYFPETQKVEVQPLIERRIKTEDGEEFTERLPIISDVPVAFPRTRKYFITFPLEPDDIVTLWISERSLDSWLSSNGRDIVDPDDFRMHEITDAVAYPGGYPFSVPIRDISKDTMALGRDSKGIQIHLKEDEIDIRLAGQASKHVPLVEDLEALWGRMKAYVDAHIHPTGTGPSGPPSSPSPAWDSGINSNVVAIPENK